MDLGDTGLLISGLIIGTLGMAAFIYGKRTQRLKWMGIGLALTIAPWFVHSIVLVWVLAAAGSAGLALLPNE